MIEHRPIAKSLHERQADTIDALIVACQGLIERLNDSWPLNAKDEAAIEKAHAAMQQADRG